MRIHLQILVLSVESYNLKCPSPAHWKLRARVKCNSTLKYFCLYNIVKRRYVEGCTGPDWDRKGKKYETATKLDKQTHVVNQKIRVYIVYESNMSVFGWVKALLSSIY